MSSNPKPNKMQQPETTTPNACPQLGDSCPLQASCSSSIPPNYKRLPVEQEAGGVVSHTYAPAPVATEATVETQAWLDETTATPADVVVVLKAQQATTKRMVGIIGHGAIGRKVTHYLQERGVACVALGATPPAHLSVDRLADSLLTVLATEIPQGQQLLQESKVAKAKEGIAAGFKQHTASLRVHPAQLAADAKQAAKRAKRAADRQRTLQGKLATRNQAEAKADLLASVSPWKSEEVLHELAERGIVVPPTVAGATLAS